MMVIFHDTFYYFWPHLLALVVAMATTSAQMYPDPLSLSEVRHLTHACLSIPAYTHTKISYKVNPS